LISQAALVRQLLYSVQIYKIVNKKLPCVGAQGSFYIFLTSFPGSKHTNKSVYLCRSQKNSV